MISFYPGPSRVHDEIPRYVNDAARLGILSINHRSDVFVELSKTTIRLLKEKLNIPKQYTVLFTSSATECWEIIAQSLVRKKSIHFYNGAFGEKWFTYTQRLKPDSVGVNFDYQHTLKTSVTVPNDAQVICITQNETSNGTQVSNTIIRAIKKNNQHALVAVDATSSMGGIVLDFKAADIWFASVQKCFGLPAGLGLMVCSPRAVEEAKLNSERNHYNSFIFMNEMMQNWQTPFTPNVLGIYLLMRVLKNSPTIKETHQKILARAERWRLFFEEQKFTMLVSSDRARSHTVLVLQGEPEFILALKRKAKKAGFIVGDGYGSLKSTTFRVANFPALKDKEVNALMKFLKNY